MAKKIIEYASTFRRSFFSSATLTASEAGVSVSVEPQTARTGTVTPMTISNEPCARRTFFSVTEKRAHDSAPASGTILAASEASESEGALSAMLVLSRKA
jgi:hypothetical protein